MERGDLSSGVLRSWHCSRDFNRRIDHETGLLRRKRYATEGLPLHVLLLLPDRLCPIVPFHGQRSPCFGHRNF